MLKKVALVKRESYFCLLFAILMKQIRPTKATDLPRLMKIFEEARQFMASVGNPTQWGDGYPEEATLRGDIERGVSYVVEEDGVIVGTFAFILGEDPTYRLIDDGAWVDDEQPYGTIHRLASLTASHGVADACLDWCGARIDNLRADTHRDNLVLQHILTSRGFQYCGIIYVRHHSPRLAYQRISPVQKV